MKDVMKYTAFIIVIIVVVAPFAWLQFGWAFAVVVTGAMVAGVLGVVIWSAILEARRRS